MLGTPWHTCLVPKGKGVCVASDRCMGEGPRKPSGRSLVPTGASQPWLHQHRWAQGKAETGRQQPITQEQGPG